MTWTCEEVEAEWGAGERLPDDEVAHTLECFERVERSFGRDWMRRRTQGSRGWWTVAMLVTDGELLSTAEQLIDNGELLGKLREDDASAWAELTVAHLLYSAVPHLHVRLGPAVQVGLRERRPDLSAWIDNDAPTYIEVTQPQRAKGFQDVRERISRIVQPAIDVLDHQSVEVYLREVPSDDEIASINAQIAEMAGEHVLRRIELAEGLGLIILNEFAPGKFETKDHDSLRDAKPPMLGAVGRSTATEAQVAVRIAFSDKRAESVLRSEARQLPKSGPGFIAIHVAGAVGAMTTWRHTIERRFQPGQHTRVAGVLLIRTGFSPRADGSLGWEVTRRWISNPHAQLSLPDWLRSWLEDRG